MTASNLSCPDIERQLVAAVLIVPERLPDARELVRVDDILNGRLRAVYGALCALEDRGLIPDPWSVGEFLKADGKVHPPTLEGWVPFIADVMTAVASPAFLTNHCHIVAGAADLRQMALACGEGIDACRDVRLGYDDPHQVIDQVEGQIFEIGKRRTQQCQVVEMPEAARRTAEAIRHPEKGPTTIDTGIPDLDRRMGGLRPGEMVIPAAGPGTGKTALAGQIALNASRDGHHVLFLSLEMTVEQNTQRLLANLGSIDSNTLRTGRLMPDDRAALDKAEAELAQLPIALFEDHGTTVAKLRGIARRRRARGQLDLLIVDYLQLMSDPSKRNRIDEISAISGGLKCLAGELGVPIIAASQLNRVGASDERPQLHHLRDSGALEQDADAVLLLTLDRSANETDKVVTLGANLAKNRHGEPGRFSLAFRRNTFQIAGLATVDDPQRKGGHGR